MTDASHFVSKTKKIPRETTKRAEKYADMKKKTAECALRYYRKKLAHIQNRIKKRKGKNGEMKGIT